jgi:hypothetical protein
MITPKIISVQPLEHNRLLIKFANGIEKVYDCTVLLDRKLFQTLKNEAFFKSVRVDPGGYGVSWNEYADLSEYELWTIGVEVARQPSTI